MRSPSILTLAFCLIVPASADAQETRAEEIAAKQKEKAAALKPYQPNAFEKIMASLEESFVSPPSGFYPAFGSIYPGGGFTFGAGYRQFYGRSAVWNVQGLYSLKNYKQVEVGTSTPWHGRGRFGYEFKGGWLDAPQVGYYGIGMEGDAGAQGELPSLKRAHGGGDASIPSDVVDAARQARSVTTTSRRAERQGQSPVDRDDLPPRDRHAGPGFEDIAMVRTSGDGGDRLADVAGLLAEGRLLRRHGQRVLRPVPTSTASRC